MAIRATSIMPGQGERTQSLPNSDSVWSRRASMLPSMSWKKSSEIQILLDGDQQFIHTYSTFDEISGCVNLRFEKDTLIDALAITFQGQANTWIEKAATTSPVIGKVTGKHTFMRVQQPIDSSCLPEDNLALSGVTYTIPFKFVVPDRVLDFVCSHKVRHPSIKDCHLQLPPSIGDPMLAGEGNTLMDDLAPKMSKISYVIKVAMEKISKTSQKTQPLSEEIGIRVVPAREELPPLEIDPKNIGGGHKYSLRKEKTVRKGIMNIGKRVGCLTAETFQPASLKLPHPSVGKHDPIATTTTIRLRYDPASADEQPPALNNISSKLKVYTFIGAAPWSYTPAPDAIDVYSTAHTQYPATVDLLTRKLSNVDWIKHDPGMSRRASVLSASTSSTASSTDNSSNDSASTVSTTTVAPPSTSYDALLPYYTVSVSVPVAIPTSSSPSSAPSTRKPSISSTKSGTEPSNKAKKSMTSSSKHITFLPTFHSCLISRLYSLEFSLTSSSAPTINLRVPVQVSLPYVRSPSSSPLPTFSSVVPPYFERNSTHFDNVEPNVDRDEEIAPDADMNEDDEALAQALDATHLHHHFRTSGRRRLGDVPEDSHVDVDTYFQLNDRTTTPTNTTTRSNQIRTGTRHMSLPSISNSNSNSDDNNNNNNRPALSDLPPDYDSVTRRMPRQQRRSQGSVSDVPSSLTDPTLANAWRGSGNDGSRPLVVRYITG